MPPLGLPTGDNIVEINVRDIINWIQNLSPCNQEGVETRNMYHYTFQNEPTVVIGLDADVSILSAHVFVSHLPDHDSVFQTK